MTKNPFEYESAKKLSNEEVFSYFENDFNLSRFLESKRNVFLIGQRGTGKTMALRYYSLPVQLVARQADSVFNEAFFPIYVSCKTPLFHRKEHELLDPLLSSLWSEHVLVFSVVHAFCTDLRLLESAFDSSLDKVSEELAYVFGDDFPTSNGLWDNTLRYITHLNFEAQKAINDHDDRRLRQCVLLSFGSGLFPIVDSLTRILDIPNAHYSFMIDDAHHLNEHQVEVLNSWIAFRDNSMFSFKVATSKVDRPPLDTASGGTILEGHDFTTIDLQQPYQNNDSDYAKMATKIVEKRIQRTDADDQSADPRRFFPISADFEKDLTEAKLKVEESYKRANPDATKKQIADYVYKFGRVQYFRDRSSKANRPPYSGFETLVHMSTGVIRNLLDPCYFMYEKALSEKHGMARDVTSISPKIQREVILQRSQAKWEFVKSDLARTITDCNEVDASRVFRLFDGLAVLFVHRLSNHDSEPRAIKFTISGYKPATDHASLARTITIASRAELIYSYVGPAKSMGRRETYYVPNRVLWPDRGLDVVGQHAAVSISATKLTLLIEMGKDLVQKGETTGEGYEFEF